MHARRSTVFAIGALCALTLVAFSPFLAHRKALAPLDIVESMYQPWSHSEMGAKPITVRNHFVSDAVEQYLGYGYVASRSLKEDGYIGWNPLSFGGKPEHANTMGLYYDWTMQLYRWLGFWDAWHLGLMLQFVIAGTGMLILLRAQSLSLPTSLAGAIAYAGNSQFILWIYHRWTLGSFCWVPWLVWALERARSKSPARVAVFGVFTALAFLGGTLQHAAFVLLVIACVVASWQVSPRRSLRSAIQEVVVASVGTVLAMALAAMMFVPSVQAFHDNAVVGHHRGGFGYHGGWLQAVFYPIIVLCSAFPTVLGNVRSLDVAKLFKGDLFGVLYFGFLPVLIAIGCLVLRRKQTPRAPWILMLAGLVLPATPLEGWLYTRVSLLYIFGGVWAFAHFWDTVDRETVRVWGSKALAAFVVVSVLWAAASTVVTAKRPAVSEMVKNRLTSNLTQGHFGMYRDWMLERADNWVSGFPIWSGAQAVPWALAGVSLLLLRYRRAATGLGVTYALSMVLMLQIGLFAADWVTLSPLPRSTVLPQNQDILELQKLAGKERVLLVTEKGSPPLFPPNTLNTFGIATLEGYESIWPVSMWHKHGFSESGDVLSKLGVRFAIVQKGRSGIPDCWQPQGPQTQPCWPLVQSAGTFGVYRNDQAHPRYTVRTGGGKASVQEISETFNRRRFSVPAGAVELRVIENWSAGWRYRIGRSPWHPAIQAPDMSMVLPLDGASKDRTVELEYRPSGWGRHLSLFVWVGVSAVLALTALRRALPI